MLQFVTNLVGEYTVELIIFNCIEHSESRVAMPILKKSVYKVMASPIG